MDTLQLPNLPTLHQPPSWLNAGGKNVDRSACMEVRLGELRRVLGLAGVDKKRRKWYLPWPEERPAGNFKGRIKTGVLTINDAMLEGMLRVRLPRRLKGDWRTERAPAMRSEFFRPPPEGTRHPQNPKKIWKGFKVRVTSLRTQLPSLDFGLAPNPNQGKSRTKVLGLPENWWQAVRVETWDRGKNHGLGTTMNYFVCPCGTPPHPGSDGKHGLPKLSTVPRGAKAKGCPQRVKFLYLVQCTKEEWRDAQAAQRWIAGLAKGRPRDRLQAWAEEQGAIDKLKRRYGMLFSPRRLICARCLGVTYALSTEQQRVAQKKWREKKRAEAKAAAERPGTLGWVRKVEKAVGVVVERREKSA